MWASHCSGSSFCGAQAQGCSSCSMSAGRCGFQALAHKAPQLWHTGSIAHGVFPHQGSHLHLLPGRRILYHRATRAYTLDSSFPHMYLVKEAGIKRPGSWESSATVLAVPSKALGPLASTSTSLGLFPPLRNALLLDCSPPSSSVPEISEARILEGVPFPSLQDSILKIFLLDIGFDGGRGIPSRA